MVIGTPKDDIAETELFSIIFDSHSPYDRSDVSTQVK
jgi:hypothetical protein